MSTFEWISALPKFLILLPSAASCYFPTKNQMKYTPFKTAVICMTLLIPYSFFGAWINVSLEIDVNTILLPSLVLFFFIYLHTVNTDFPRALAVYVGVCAVQTFPAQFAYALDAKLHPMSGAAHFSTEASLFQLGLSCLIVIAFFYPACHIFSRAVDNLNLPMIWYCTVILSSVFFVLNIMCIPHSYNTLHVGRLGYIFPFMEVCAMTLIIIIYVLFYMGAKVILEHARLKEHSQLLEMQAHQYNILREHMNQTSRLRHDFRHSVRLISSLAEKGDIESIQKYLKEYELRIKESMPINYCANASLNALFGYYHEMADSEGIQMEWNIQLPNPLTISELDMAGLFGNIIENAIAGCLEAPRNSRYFYLTTEIRHGNKLYIVSTNSFGGKIIKGKDGYQSTRHVGKGIGLVSIAAIAEKYHGSSQVSNNDNEFFVDVVLKI